jgi:hypothetical protein
LLFWASRGTITLTTACNSNHSLNSSSCQFMDFLSHFRRVISEPASRFCPSLPEIEFRSYLDVISRTYWAGADKHPYTLKSVFLLFGLHISPRPPLEVCWLMVWDAGWNVWLRSMQYSWPVALFGSQFDEQLKF